jgi:hypothetical protein
MVGRTVVVMRKLALCAVLLLLTGCSADREPIVNADPMPDSSVNLPGDMKVIGPVILGESDTVATVVAGVDMVVFDLPEPSSWTATVTPAELVVFEAGSDDSTMITNPGLYPLKEGVVTVELTNPAGRTLTYTITITTPPVDTTLDPMEDAAAASEAFGLTVLGMFEVDAIDAIEGSGRVARVAERDGEGFILTKDYNPSRLNLVIVTGLVSSVYVG